MRSNSSITNKFSECTAFLNYQSTNSEDIINDYFDYKIAYDTASGNSGTVEMLRYLRNNVRSSFDKTTEDAMAVFVPEANQYKWHSVPSANKFQMDVRSEYSSSIALKLEYLENLIAVFEELPD